MHLYIETMEFSYRLGNDKFGFAELQELWFHIKVHTIECWT